MSADAGAVPAPGSDAAIKAGCTCPAEQNAGGRGVPCKWDSAGNETTRAYWITNNCPVHDPLSDLHMRPRTGAGGAPHVD